MTTFDLRIDHADDNSFSSSLIHDALELHWQLGTTSHDERVASPSWAKVRLIDRTQAYTPALIGKRLRIYAHDGTIERVMFTGQITGLQPVVGSRASRETLLMAQDALTELETWRVRLPMAFEQRADEVVQTVLLGVPLRPVPRAERWQLGRVGRGELGTLTRLLLLPPMSLQTGKTAFSVVGDTWGEGIRARDAIAEVVNAEAGRFFISREGVFTLYNRHHAINAPPIATLDNDYEALLVAHENALSRVSVRYLPRLIGAPNSILWHADTSLACAPQSVRHIRLTWRDDQDRPQGAVTVIPPQAPQDFTVNTHAQGTGITLKDGFTVWLSEVSLSGCVFSIRNGLNQTVYVRDAYVRGTPLTAHDAQTVSIDNLNTRAMYGARERVEHHSPLNTPEKADAMARYTLGRHDTAQTTAKRVTLSARQHAHAILNVTLLDTVRVLSAYPAHQADYWVVGEEHHVTHTGTRHHATWTLEKANTRRYWQLGNHALGTETRLLY